MCQGATLAARCIFFAAASLLLLAEDVWQCVHGTPSLDTTAPFGQLHFALPIPWQGHTAKPFVVKSLAEAIASLSIESSALREGVQMMPSAGSTGDAICREEAASVLQAVSPMRHGGGGIALQDRAVE